MSTSFITPKEFSNFYLNNREKLVSIASSYVRERQAAEDIVAEVFASFWEEREYINISSSLEAYAVRAVKNRALNYIRDVIRRFEKDNLTDTDEYAALLVDAELLASDSLSFVFKSEVSGIFHDILNNMPERARSIFLASRFNGKTYQEIAESMNVSERIVKRDIQSTLNSLRKALKDYLPLFIVLFPDFF